MDFADELVEKLRQLPKAELEKLSRSVSPNYKEHLAAFQLADQLYHQIREGKIPIDWNGHLRSSATTAFKYVRDYGFYLDAESVHNSIRNSGRVPELANAVESNTPLEHPVDLPLHHSCKDCGNQFALRTDGQTFRVISYALNKERNALEFSDAPCPYPDGMPPFVFRLECPSGKLVMRDDLTDFFPEQMVETHGLDTDLGVFEWSAFYAAQGMLHGFVGNSCPGIFQHKGSDTILIGQSEGKTLRDPTTGARARQVGSICTGLWWYSVADQDTLAQKDNDFLKQVLEDPFTTVVNVPPGTYELTHQAHRIDMDAWPSVYAWMKRV